MTDICIFSILTDEIKAAVVCLVLKAHLVSEGSWHHVDLPGRAQRGVLRRPRLYLDSLDEQIIFDFRHVADDLPLKVFFADLFGLVAMRVAHVSHGHPRMLPDLFQCRSVPVIIGHHF